MPQEFRGVKENLRVPRCSARRCHRCVRWRIHPTI